MHMDIPDNALFADLFPARFKLGLDEADQLAIGAKDTQHRRQYLRQGNEGNIDGGKIPFIGHLFMGHIAHVGLFQADHPLIISELPRKLAIAHIDGIDLLCAVLQHTIGEAAGGGADIQTNLAFQFHAEFVDGLFQLIAAAADIFHLAALYFNIRMNSHLCAGFILLLAVNIHVARHDIGLCQFSGVCQTQLHQQHVQSFFFYLFCHGQSPNLCLMLS